MILGCGLLLASCTAPYLERTLSPVCQEVLARGVDRTTPAHQLTPEGRDARSLWEACDGMAEDIRRIPRVTLPAGYEPAPVSSGAVRCFSIGIGMWSCH